MQRNEWIFLGAGLLSAAAVFVTGLGFKREYTPPPRRVIRVPVPDNVLAREIPLKFPARSYRPALTEGRASGSIGLPLSAIERDLVRINDPGVYWESDAVKNGPEDDHVMHRAIVDPFRRLVHQVAARGGTLEVHDAYRPDGGDHSPNSLHKEGRALDLTCDQMTMEELAALCWAAGFDWVLHEHPKNGGVHVHCSVRHDKEPLTFEMVAKPE